MDKYLTEKDFRVFEKSLKVFETQFGVRLKKTRTTTDLPGTAGEEFIIVGLVRSKVIDIRAEGEFLVGYDNGTLYIECFIELVISGKPIEGGQLVGDYDIRRKKWKLNWEWD